MARIPDGVFGSSIGGDSVTVARASGTSSSMGGLRGRDGAHMPGTLAMYARTGEDGSLPHGMARMRAIGNDTGVARATLAAPLLLLLVFRPDEARAAIR